MDILNMVFTGLFTIEMVLKIIAFKPKVCPRPTPYEETPWGRKHIPQPGGGEGGWRVATK
jgi:hypothetical protein